MRTLRHFVWLGTTVLLSLMAGVDSAQNVGARAPVGRVVDTGTGMPLAVTDMRLPGTKYATISDANGPFTSMNALDGSRSDFGETTTTRDAHDGMQRVRTGA